MINGYSFIRHTIVNSHNLSTIISNHHHHHHHQSIISFDDPSPSIIHPMVTLFTQPPIHPSFNLIILQCHLPPLPFPILHHPCLLPQTFLNLDQFSTSFSDHLYSLASLRFQNRIISSLSTSFNPTKPYHLPSQPFSHPSY